MSFSQTEATIIQILPTLQQQVCELTEAVEGLHATVTEMEPAGKEFYTTSELAEVLGVSRFTVTERYCNQGRIECTKDGNGKWVIPSHEYERLRRGGRPNGN